MVIRVFQQYGASGDQMQAPGGLTGQFFSYHITASEVDGDGNCTLTVNTVANQIALTATDGCKPFEGSHQLTLWNPTNRTYTIPGVPWEGKYDLELRGH